MPIAFLTSLWKIVFRISFGQLGYPQLNSVNCQAEGDLMRLSGTLNSFYLKQVAQSVAVKTPGVRSVENQIQVIESDLDS